jgi:hypothetical protein
MTDVTINDAMVNGLHIYNSSVNVSKITVRNSGIHAVQIDYSDDVTLRTLIANSAFAGNTVNILKSTNVSILDKSVITTSNYFCILLQKSDLNIHNTTTNVGSGNALNISAGSTVISVNSTIAHDKVVFKQNDTSMITRYWYFNVYVTTEGGVPIGYATVNVTDLWNDTIYSKITEPFGHYGGKAFWLRMYESIQNNTGSFFNNTYYVSANATARKTNTTTVVADQHREIPLWLWYNQAPGNVTNLTPLKTHDDTPSFTWNKSTDPEGDEVSYHVVVSDGKTILEDTIVPNNYYNVTDSVQPGIYYIDISAIDDSGAEGNVSQNVVEISNTKPTSPTITLTPGSPNTGNDLVMTITVASADPDDDPGNSTSDLIRYTVKWWKNGVEQTGLEKTKKVFLNATGATVSSSLTTIGDTWKVEVTAYDGHNASWVLNGMYGAHSNATPVSQQVTVGNRIPYIDVTPGLITILEDGSDATSLNLKTLFKDPDMEDSDPTETLTFSSALHPSYTVQIVQSTGAVTITPNADYYTLSGNDLIKFYAIDASGGKVSYDVNVTVTGVNDNPVAEAIVDQIAWEDKLFVIYLNASDAKDGDDVTPTHNFTDIPSLEASDITETGTANSVKVEFTPDNSMVGNYTISVSFDDGNSGVVGLTFKLQIVNTNDEPTVPQITAPADNSEYVEDTPISFTGSATDDDVMWGDILTFTWSSDVDGTIGAGTSVDNYDQLTVGTHKIYLSVTDSAVTKESFITIKIKAKVPEVVPNATLLSPSNETTLGSTDPVTLKWTSNHELGAEFTYDVYFGTGLTASTRVKEGHASTSYEQSGLEDGKTYYWKVVPLYGTVRGPPSEIFNFDVNLIVIRPTPTCTLESPENNTTETTLSVELKWASAHANKADFTYDLYWGTSRFDLSALPTANMADLTTTSYTVTGLSDDTRYYWTVVPVDLDDARGICISDPPIREFYVDTGGGKTDVTANLLEPGNGSTQKTTAVVLKWGSSDSGASSYTYKVFIGTNANPITNAPIVSGVKTTEYTFSVENLKTYYWTVIPNDDGDGICLDGIWSFSVDFDFEEKHELDVTGGNDVSIDVGKTHQFTLTVKNNGNVEETVDVTVDNGGLAGITTDPTSIVIPADSQKTISVDLVIPDSAGAGDYTVTVKFTPEGEATPLAEETFKVTVSKPKKDGGEKESNMMLIGIILVVVVVIVLVVVMMLMKGKKKGGEAPADEGELPAEEPSAAIGPEPGVQPAAGPAPAAPAPQAPAPAPSAPEPEPPAPDASVPVAEPEAGETPPETPQ